MRIRWDNGAVNSYRMGESDRYDLTLAPSELQPKTKERETKDEPEDADISVCECSSTTVNMAIMWLKGSIL